MSSRGEVAWVRPPREETSGGVGIRVPDEADRRRLDDVLGGRASRATWPADGGFRVLMVEDNPHIVEMYSYVLKKLATAELGGKVPMEVHFAADGHAGLQALADGPFHLVLTDLYMPVHGRLRPGAEDEIRADGCANIPVMAIAAGGREAQSRGPERRRGHVPPQAGALRRGAGDGEAAAADQLGFHAQPQVSNDDRDTSDSQPRHGQRRGALHPQEPAREPARGRSNKLAEVKTALEPAVCLEFDTYFFFLQEVPLHRHGPRGAAQADRSGERVVDGADLDRFSGEVGEFFSEQLAPVDEPMDGPLLLRHRSDDRRRLRGATRLDPSSRSGPRLSPSPPPRPRPRCRPTPVGISTVATPGASPRRRPARRGVPGPAARPGDRGLHQGAEGHLRVLLVPPAGRGAEAAEAELCAQAQVRHPAVVAIVDQNIDGARPYCVMELLSGSLRDQLDGGRAGRASPVHGAIRTFLQLCVRPARRATPRGLTHHNLKPENVLFDACGNAKLARLRPRRVIEVEPGKGMPQVFVGTGGMSYLAPELHRPAEGRRPGRRRLRRWASSSTRC